jgi:hypothetical protein
MILSKAHTKTAHAGIAKSVFISICIGFCIFMAVNAVGLFLNNGAPHIFQVSDWLKMCWINAASNTAKMVQFQTFWDISPVDFIRDDMGQSSMGAFSEADIPIASTSNKPKPNNASAFSYRDAQIGQPFKNRAAWSLTLLAAVNTVRMVWIAEDLSTCQTRFGMLISSHCGLPQITLVRAVRCLRDAARPVSILASSQCQEFQKLNQT